VGYDNRHGGSIHASGDNDYYRFTVPASGNLSLLAAFDQILGNLDMQLLNAGGAVVAASAGTTNTERIERAVAAGETYYLRVYGHQGAINPFYGLVVDGPEHVPVTVNQSPGQRDPSNGLLISFDVRFSAPVTGFTAADISFVGSTVGGTLAVADILPTGAGNGSAYTLLVRGMNGAGTVVASIPADAAFDPAGNATAASTSTDNSVTFDNVRPTVTINQAAGQADPAVAGPVTFAVNFSEPVTGFTAADVSFAGSTVGGALAAAVAGSGASYTVSVTGMDGTGTVVASIPADAAADAVGILSAASTGVDNSVVFDNVRPTVRIRKISPDPTNRGPIIFQVDFFEFDDAVFGYTPGDISFAGSTVGGTLVADIESLDQGHVVVTGMSGAGTVVVSIPAGAVTDAAGNPNVASATTTFTFDNVAPRFETRSFRFEALQALFFTFSEAVGALTPADLNLVNTTTGATVPTAKIYLNGFTDRTRVFRFDYPGGALPDGNYRLTVTGRPTDAVGNPLDPGTPLEFFVLSGDINRDRAVNGTDFAILAGNFGKTGQTYAQGDLTGDGAVNGSDFAILAGNFGNTVAAAVVRAAATRPAPVAAEPKRVTPAAPRRPGPRRLARPMVLPDSHVQSVQTRPARAGRG
jgi:hypothetical protein